MNKKFDGDTWVKCIRLVSDAFNEVNALIDSIDELFLEELSPPGKFDRPVQASDWKDGSGADESGWVDINYAAYLPIKPRGSGNKSTSAYIGYQLSMIGDGIKLEGNDQPLLHVFLMRDEPEIEDGQVLSLAVERVGDLDYMPVDTGYLLAPGGLYSEDWRKQEWFFSVRLVGLESVDDLKRFVVSPAIALLEGKGHAQAWGAMCPPCLVRYGLNERGLKVTN